MPTQTRSAGSLTGHGREIITHVKVTEGIHPDVIATSHSCGHWKYGRFATAGEHKAFGGRDDAEADAPWYRNEALAGKGAGVHPNEIIPNWGDPIGGMQRWGDAVVTVTKVS